MEKEKSNIFYITFPGLFPWQRARTKNGIYFDSQIIEKRQLSQLCISQAKALNFKKLDCPLASIIICYKKYPTNFSKKKKNDFLLPCDKKPDLDNIEKFIFDMMEKQANLIENDSRIVAKLSFKYWGKCNATVFILGQWTGNFLINNNIVGLNGFNYRMYDRSFEKQ